MTNQKYGRRLTMSGEKLIATILKVALGIDYDDIKIASKKFFRFFFNLWQFASASCFSI